MIRNLLYLLVLTILVIVGLSIYHFKSTETLQNQTINLYHWEDKSNISKPENIPQVADFKVFNLKKINLGLTNTVHWFAFKIDAENTSKSLILDITNFRINEIELYEIFDKKPIIIIKTGDKFSFDKRPIASKTFAFPIELNDNQSGNYLIKIDNRGENLTTEINLWNTTDFEDREQRYYFLWGIFFGIGFLVVVINLFFYFSTYDLVYFTFSICIIGILFRQLIDTGLAFQYLWPNFPNLNFPDPLILSLWFYIAAIIRFQIIFLDLKNENSFLYKINKFTKITFEILFISLIIIVLTNFVSEFPNSPILISRLHSILSVLVTTLFFINCFWGIKSKNNLIKLYSFAFFIQILLQLIVIVQNLFRNNTETAFFQESNLILLFVFLIDLIVFTYILAYRYRKLGQENTSLQLSLAKNKQELNANIIEMLEMERNQINKTLQNLVGDQLKIALSFLEKTENSEMKSEAEKLIKTVRNDLDYISKNTNSIQIFDKGITQRLKEIIEKLNNSQAIQFKINIEGSEIKLNSNQEVQLFRIANELINNILKHSNASAAEIYLKNMDNILVLIVSDNGTGFNQNNESNGIGLKNIQARAKELNAKIEINSDKKGTKIEIVLPLPNQPKYTN
jgi:two-component system, sensor histidine kinase LadS